MAMGSTKAQCFTCHKEKITYPCDGCSQRFCLSDLQEHRQVLSEHLNEVINEHNQLKQIIIEQKQQNPHIPSLIEQINQWERISTETIRRTAQQCREIVIGQMDRVVDQIDERLAHLTVHLKHVREENEFNEIDLQRLTQQLTAMKQELTNSPDISIRQSSQTLINKIHVTSSIFNKRRGQIGRKSSGKVSRRRRETS